MKATIHNTKEGSVVRAVSDFGCLDKGSEQVVKSRGKNLYIECAKGRHYLAGQLDVEGTYVNLELVTTQKD